MAGSKFGLHHPGGPRGKYINLGLSGVASVSLWREDKGPLVKSLEMEQASINKAFVSFGNGQHEKNRQNKDPPFCILGT